jgi:hypothetical protein
LKEKKLSHDAKHMFLKMKCNFNEKMGINGFTGKLLSGK